MNLSEAIVNKEYIISNLEMDGESKSKFYERGIIPGLEIVPYRYFQGSCMIRSIRGRFAISKDYLEMIIVEELHSQ